MTENQPTETAVGSNGETTGTATEPDIAILHGQFFAYGGGVRVAEELARTFDAPLYYGFGDDDLLSNDIETHEIHTGRVAQLLSNTRITRDVYHMWADLRVPEIAQYDIVIQSGNEFGWYVPPDDQVVLRYTHSTSRTPYDLYHERAESPFIRLYGYLVRWMYLPNIPFVDCYIANSDIVARRIEKYWGRSAAVVYPPVDVDSYPTSDPDAVEEGLYFTFSRLFPNKRLGPIVEAFRERPEKRLLIAGKGPERDRLEPQSPANVDWVGYVSEEEKREMLNRAEAFVFNARNEDFGLVPVEALASGTPVIGVKDGFTQYQIFDGKNGHTYERGKLGQAIDQFASSGVAWSPDEIAADASRYDVSQFRREIRDLVRQTALETEIEGPKPRQTTQSPMANGGQK